MKAITKQKMLLKMAKQLVDSFITHGIKIYGICTLIFNSFGRAHLHFLCILLGDHKLNKILSFNNKHITHTHTHTQTTTL